MTTTAQSYVNHTHQPRLWVVGLVLWLLASGLIVYSWVTGNLLHAGLVCLLGAVLCSLLIGRMYITRLQDRIIRLEMQVRCSAFLSPAEQAELDRLSMKQRVALRFASDTEIPGLLERIRRERLTPDQIKRAVVTWVPDHDRT